MIPADLRSEMKHLAMLVPSICSEGLVFEEQNLFPSQVASCNVSSYTPKWLWARYRKAASSLWGEQSCFFLPLPICNINKQINNNLPTASLLLEGNVSYFVGIISRLFVIFYHHMLLSCSVFATPQSSSQFWSTGSWMADWLQKVGRARGRWERGAYTLTL